MSKIGEAIMNLNEMIHKSLGTLLLLVLGWTASTIKELNSSVVDLNQKMAVIISTIAIHDKKIEDITQLVIRTNSQQIVIETMEKRLSEIEQWKLKTQ
jgi:hypothetical protein